MATAMKIKVRTADLISAIEKRRQEHIDQQAEAVAAYPALLEEWKKAAHKKIYEWIVCVNAGEEPELSRNYGGGLPHMPSKPRACELGGYDRDIATLRMSAEDVIAISAEDYARYVR